MSASHFNSIASMYDCAHTNSEQKYHATISTFILPLHILCCLVLVGVGIDVIAAIVVDAQHPILAIKNSNHSARAARACAQLFGA